MKFKIIIDDWKLEIFERVFTRSGYTIERLPSPAPGTLALLVTADDSLAVASLVAAAQEEAARTKQKAAAIARA